jgi:formylglycine-generating enzyme required for sulfatase activity
VNDAVAVFSRKQIARILLTGGLILTIGGYQFSSRSHAETNKTSAATKPGKVALMVRGANERDEKRFFTPGEGKTESFQDCIDNDCTTKGPEMVVVPAGSFMMGANSDQHGRAEEDPQHNVTINRPFAVGKFAVTFAEWDTCVADGGCGGYKPSDQGWGRGDRPVIRVGWDDAKAYAAWLSKKTGKSYRLLSDAEREYVARAGTTTPFWWGTTIGTDQANYAGIYTYEGGRKGEFRGKTVQVKSFQTNPWGLYQVHGNVWEWCEDVWHDNYNDAPTDGGAWSKDGDNSRRVLRGGSWFDYPGWLRAASRRGDQPVIRYSNVGFRLART